MPPFLCSSSCLFLPRSLCCSWYNRLTLSINSHFSQQPVKLTKFLARISFSCRTLRSSMSFRQLRSDREALRMVTAASSGFQFRDKGKQRKRNQTTVGIILTANSTVNMLRFSWVFIVWMWEELSILMAPWGAQWPQCVKLSALTQTWCKKHCEIRNL